MPRNTTPTEDTVLASKNSEQHVMVQVKNAAGTFQDVGTLSSVDWQMRVEVSQDVDTKTVIGSVTLWLVDELGNSLSPLYGASPDIALGRDIRIYGARLALNSGRPASASSDWKLLLDGFIDRWEITGAPGNERLLLESVDHLGGRLAQRWVEEEDEYGSEAGISIESVSGSILTDWTSGPISLYVPTSPSYNISPALRHQKMTVRESLDAMWTGLLGWTVEPRWDDGTSAWRLTAYEPDRTASVADYSFGPDEYYELPVTELDMEAIRNAIVVRYTKASTSERSKYEATSSSSITAYERQFMELEFASDSPIDTDAEATTVGDAALSDLADPDADHEARLDFYWPVQINDYVGFTANDVHYSSTQNWAVTGYRHVFENGRGLTFLRVRGKPTAGVRSWKRRPPERLSPFGTLAPFVTASNTLTSSADGNERAGSWRILASKTGIPTEAEIQAETALNGRNLSASDVGNINDVATGSALAYSAGETIYIGFQVYSEADGAGAKSPVLSWVGRPTDPDEDAEVSLASLGFGDDGELAVGAIGDEDTTEIYVSAGAGTTPTTPGTVVTTVDSNSTGSTLNVASTFGRSVGEWIAADLGGNEYWGRITAINAGVSFTVSPAISGTVPSGADVYFLGSGKIAAQQGLVLLDGSGQASVVATIGQSVGVKIMGVNRNHSLGGTSQLGPVFGTFSRRRGDTEFVEPMAHVTMLRSGSSVSVRMVVEDPSLAVTANPFYYRLDGDTQALDVSAQTSWDTSTGTAGSATQLLRYKTLADPYTAIEIHITYRDANGSTITKKFTLELASVQELEKSIRLTATAFTPGDDSIGWDIAGETLYPNGAGERIYNMGLSLPPGVEITDFTAELWRTGTSDSAVVRLRAPFGTGGTAGDSIIATLTHDASSGWQEKTTTLSEAVGATERFYLQAVLNGNAGTQQAGIRWSEITYAAPSFKQTY